MKKRIRFCFCMLALLLAIAQPMTAVAAAFDNQAPCTLTLHYAKEGRAFGDLKIEIYQVAAFESDGTYALTDLFAPYPVKIHEIQSQLEWQQSTQALVSYVEADALAPLATGMTDEAGTVTFENLATGLYLVLGVEASTETARFWFQPFLVFLPTMDESGDCDYDVEAKPKAGESTSIYQYKVVKLWKDSGNQANRPDSVTVEILKDGVLHETVVLNEQNNWSHSWETTDGSSRWTVAEQEVPSGYQVAISFQDGTYTITNERPGSPGDPPKTGDSTPLLLYVIAMIVSGTVLVVLGVPRKRKMA